jgi:hypothetical protein
LKVNFLFCFQGLYGPKYVWFFIGWYEDDWFQKHLDDEHINCTVAQMEEAAEAHFTTEALQWNQDKSPTISGKVGQIQLNCFAYLSQFSSKGKIRKAS